MSACVCRTKHGRELSCVDVLLQQRMDVRASLTEARRMLDLCRTVGHAGPALYPGLCARCIRAIKQLYDDASGILGGGDAKATTAAG